MTDRIRLIPCYRGLLAGFCALGCSLGVTLAPACDLQTVVSEATPIEVQAFFAGEKKRVLTFLGYSGAEYQEPAAMLAAARGVLVDFEPADTMVNIGATSEGIGAVYPLAKSLGFTTTGIVSTQARDYKAALSPCVDRVFYVEDAGWGGFLGDGQQLSPTSTAMVQSSDGLVAIGGGEVARDELIAARRLGKELRFIPADMNHEIAREKARNKGLPAPQTFGGAAASATAR